MFSFSICMFSFSILSACLAFLSAMFSFLSAMFSFLNSHKILFRKKQKRGVFSPVLHKYAE